MTNIYYVFLLDTEDILNYGTQTTNQIAYKKFPIKVFFTNAYLKI